MQMQLADMLHFLQIASLIIGIELDPSFVSVTEGLAAQTTREKRHSDK